MNELSAGRALTVDVSDLYTKNGRAGTSTARLACPDTYRRTFRPRTADRAPSAPLRLAGSTRIGAPSRARTRTA
jgi:hypothetical protein